LTKGSIALIQHGFNDYTYDEFYFSRQNQNQLFDDQVSMVNGGGFKTPVGSAHSIGMSNNFAAAVNFSADLPIMKSWSPFRIYFDIGTYSTYTGDAFKNNVMYNGGLSFHLKDILAIHFPLVYSEELGNIYKGQHKTFFSKISFSMNLEKLNIWKELK
jgi:hypothetical protein